MAEYTNDLRLKEIATGDESGTWGTSTNTNLELIAEAFSYSTVATFDTDADKTETIADGSTDPYRSIYVKVTSGVSLTATRTLTIAPNTVSKIFMIENATSGSQSIAISQGSGANVTIPNGDVKVIYTDGAGAGAAVVDAFANLKVTDPAQTNITSVGALDGGSITSGFGSIDVGSSAITTTGTVTGGTLAGTLTTAAQTNITSVGTLTGLDVAGRPTFDGLTVDGDMSISEASPTITFTDTTDSSTHLLQSINSTLNVQAQSILRFTTNAAEAMRIDSDGRLLINKTSPSASLNLEVQAPSGFSIGSGFYSASTQSTIEFQDTNTTADYKVRIGSETDDLVMFAGGSKRMTIDSSGNVGIGTDSPDAVLTTVNSGALTLDSNDGDYSGFGLLIEPSTLTANTVNSAIGFASSSGRKYAAIGMQTYGDPDQNGLNFYVQETTAGSSAVLSEAMRIDNSGNVGIGTTSPSSFYESHLVVGDGTGEEAITVYSGSSDTGYLLFGDATSGNARFAGQVRYDHANNRLEFATNESSTARMVVDSSGNVGIGTSSPSYTLDVEDSNDGHLAEFRGDGTNAGGRSIRIGVGNTDVPELPTYQAYIYASGSDSATNSLALVSEGGTSGTGGIDFYTGAVSAGTAQRMRITRAGSVGIGTSSPASPLHVVGSEIRVERQANTVGFGSGIIFALGDSASTTANHTYGQIFGVIEDNTNGAEDGYLTFQTSNSGTVAERMRIQSDGLIDIGPQSGSGVGRVNISANPSNNYQIEFWNTASVSVGSITVSGGGTATAYNTSSDYRLKENVVYDWTALDRLNQLKPARFNFIASADTTVDGFLAHEVASVVPEAITGEKDAVDDEDNPIYQGIDQSKLVPLLVKAVQEQQEQIESLKSEIELLKGGN